MQKILIQVRPGIKFTIKFGDAAITSNYGPAFNFQSVEHSDKKFCHSFLRSQFHLNDRLNVIKRFISCFRVDSNRRLYFLFHIANALLQFICWIIAQFLYVLIQRLFIVLINHRKDIVKCLGRLVPGEHPCL